MVDGEHPMADQEGIEGIKTRLSNIRSVEPILGAMRTISLGSWQSALHRQDRVRRYSDRLRALLPALTPALTAHNARRRRRLDGSSPATTVVLVIGSERGLCGAFNSTLVRYAQEALERYEEQGVQLELATLGSRARRALERLGREIAWSRPLPTTTLPTSQLAYELVHTWLEQYERYELDAVDLVYHTYRSATLYKPLSTRLIPPPLPSSVEGQAPWPPPYIDTDPLALYARLIVLGSTTEMYRILLDSAAAEHSARFQLMEGATQNSQRLINELTLALQSARQQAITAEMQELASGAGLLGSAPR
jgi:F-type H+-transporting ATPase subunit gamma